MSDERKTGRTLDDLVVSAVRESLDGSKLQEAIEEQIKKEVRNWVSDAFGSYGSPVRTAFRERINELVVPSIEKLGLDNARLSTVLSEIVSESVIGERAQMLGNFGKLMTVERRDVVPASEVFKAWCDFVAARYDCDGREVDMDDTPTYAPLECTCTLDAGVEGRWSRMCDGTMHLVVEDCDPEQADALNYDINLWRFSDLNPEDQWYVHYPPQPTLKDIARASDFEIYLARLDACGCKIAWDIDGDGTSEDVEPEQEPEWDVH